MGLMPVYYTMNRTPRKKVSVREKRLRENHEKWLRGFVGEPKLREKEVLKLASEKTEKYRSVGNGIGNGLRKTSPTLSGDYIVGQAYKKGNLVVLSKDDAKDESTGKRR